MTSLPTMRSIADSLEHNCQAIGGLFSGQGSVQQRTRPDRKSWSMLECLHHLLDEEREDFRARITLMLEDSSLAWPGIDPESWAVDRNYNAQDPKTIWSAFEKERRRSVVLLRNIGTPDLGLQHAHPQLGSLGLGDLLCSWLAHDQLHIAQLTRIRIQLLRVEFAPFTPTYAGA